MLGAASSLLGLGGPPAGFAGAPGVGFLCTGVLLSSLGGLLPRSSFLAFALRPGGPVPVLRLRASARVSSPVRSPPLAFSGAAALLAASAAYLTLVSDHAPLLLLVLQGGGRAPPSQPPSCPPRPWDPALLQAPDASPPLGLHSCRASFVLVLSDAFLHATLLGLLPQV